MAVDERGSPQTGDQLRTKNTNETTTSDCEGAADVVTAEQGGVNDARRTGRGRRKQCRPVRVCFRDDDDDNVDDLVAVEARPPEVSSPAEVVGLPAQNVCELCGAEETSPDALTAHATTCRGRVDPAPDDLSLIHISEPTRPY